MKDLVSIIVPIYNAEKYLDECIMSLLNQSYNNIEILLINDGSKDSSLKICNKYKNNKKIKIFNKKNSGVSDTRNYGIINSNGKFVSFVDSDDYVERDFIKNLVNSMKKNNTDLVIGSYNIVGDKIKTDEELLKKLNNVNDKKLILEKLINIEENNCIFGYIWRCLYKKEIITKNNLYFKKLKMSEDYLFLAEYVNNCRNVSIETKKMYNYRINNSSVTSKYIPTLLEDMTYVNETILNDIISSEKTLYRNYIGIVCNTYLCYIQNIAKSNKIITELKKLKSVKNKIFKKYLKERKRYNINFRKKLNISLKMFDFNLELLYIFLFAIRRRLKCLRR